ncbi:hypothetical protein OXT66_01090 [Lentilactobacillus senioris]|uniref:hypothetical protein n=1 Tax=Lentilactobacillus senioris TaxID=931534 RepID=UPI002281CB25|nr:hypothetical protein [Lentilactobacillus senioris]MCY9806140.1 hypothetical protein [Lentilactobacillus senioris]
MKKKIIGSLALMLGLTLGGLTQINQPAADASWHKGTPKAIKGHWRSKLNKININNSQHLWSYKALTFTGKKAKSDVIQGNHFIMSRPKYKYLGHGTYKIVETYHNSLMYKNKVSWYAHKVNAHKILFKMGSSSYDTYYKFSGKVSKRSFYPYP